MPSKKSANLDDDVLLRIVMEIHRIVEDQEGPQETGAREIDYAIHAVLTLLEAATRHQSNADRVESIRSAVALFNEIAESDYIQPIHNADLKKQTRH
jgi:hypothetical protein